MSIQACPSPTELMPADRLLSPAPQGAIVTGHSTPPTPAELIRQLVRQHLPSGGQERVYDGLRCQLHPGGVLEHRCAAWLPPEVVRQKLEGFLERWHARLLLERDDTLILEIPLASTLWQRVQGYPASLRVKLRLDRCRSGESKLAEVTACLRAVRGSSGPSLQVLECVAPELLQSLRSHLMASPERRTHERVPFSARFRFAPLAVPGKDPEPADSCLGQDISLGGISFLTPCRPASLDILLFFRVHVGTDAEPAEVIIPASVRDFQPVRTGGYLVRAHFALGRAACNCRALLIGTSVRPLGKMLVEATDYPLQLETAERVSTALEILVGGEMDVALVDLSQREADGLALVRQLHHASPEVPIVALLDGSQANLAGEAVRAGAVDTVVLPPAGAFSRALQAAIDRHRAEQDRILESQRQRLEEQVEAIGEKERYLAYHDVLTGLPNRAFFQNSLNQAVSRAKERGAAVGVLFLDLDGFKQVNDTLGHDAGDRLLQTVADRLRACLRASDTVARMGGDEFTIVLRELARADDMTGVANKIIQELARPIPVDGHELVVTSSIGISVYPQDGQDGDTIIKKADLAMYEAKRQGKNAYRLYQSSMGSVSESLL